MSIHVFFIFATIVYPMCHLKWMHSAKSIQKGKRRKQFFYTWYRYDDRQWPMVHQFTFGIRYHVYMMTDSIKPYCRYLQYGIEMAVGFYDHNGWNLRCTHHWRFIDHHYDGPSMDVATNTIHTVSIKYIMGQWTVDT